MRFDFAAFHFLAAESAYQFVAFAVEFALSWFPSFFYHHCLLVPLSILFAAPFFVFSTE